MSENKLRDLSSKLAQYAFKCAKEAKEKDMSKYPQYVKKMPAMIRNSGYAKAFAFGYSKGEKNSDGKVYELIYSHIRGWLEMQGLLKNGTTGDMIKELVEMDYPEYRRCINETMAFLDWLRRLAEGMFPEEAASNNDE